MNLEYNILYFFQNNDNFENNLLPLVSIVKIGDYLRLYLVGTMCLICTAVGYNVANSI